MKIIFLGTNGWYSSPTGDTPCILIDAKDRYIILDAGNGMYKLDNYIKEDKPVSLFISHLHIDHTSGLHTLAKFNFRQGLDVYVGHGRSKDFVTLVNPPFTIGYKKKPENIKNLNMEIRLHELSEGKTAGIPYVGETIKLHHAYGDHGYRLEFEGKQIAYTGDCGFTPQLKKFAKNADILICECSNKKTEQHDTWGHLDPVQAGTLARDCTVKQLILTHFGAHIYTTLEERKWAEKEAQKIFPATTAAIDGMEFNLS